jgi:hypothetical protein
MAAAVDWQKIPLRSTDSAEIALESADGHPNG